MIESNTEATRNWLALVNAGLIAAGVPGRGMPDDDGATDEDADIEEIEDEPGSPMRRGDLLDDPADEGNQRSL